MLYCVYLYLYFFCSVQLFITVMSLFIYEGEVPAISCHIMLTFRHTDLEAITRTPCIIDENVSQHLIINLQTNKHIIIHGTILFDN